MATTLTTYFFDGGNDSDSVQTFICPGNQCQYMTAYIDIVIWYGNYEGADQVGAVQPMNRPGLQNVAFNAQVWRATSGGTPISKHHTPRLIARQDIFDVDNPADCLGTKFTFQTNCMEDCDNHYCLVWSTNRVEMPYGPDMIYIGAQQGVVGTWEPCD